MYIFTHIKLGTWLTWGKMSTRERFETSPDFLYKDFSLSPSECQIRELCRDCKRLINIINWCKFWFNVHRYNTIFILYHVVKIFEYILVLKGAHCHICKIFMVQIFSCCGDLKDLFLKNWTQKDDCLFLYWFTGSLSRYVRLLLLSLKFELRLFSL